MSVRDDQADGHDFCPAVTEISRPHLGTQVAGCLLVSAQPDPGDVLDVGAACSVLTQPRHVRAIIFPPFRTPTGSRQSAARTYTYPSIRDPAATLNEVRASTGLIKPNQKGVRAHRLLEVAAKRCRGRRSSCHRRCRQRRPGMHPGPARCGELLRAESALLCGRSCVDACAASSPIAASRRPTSGGSGPGRRPPALATAGGVNSPWTGPCPSWMARSRAGTGDPAGPGAGW